MKSLRKKEDGNLSIEQIEDIRLAASLMTGEKRRAFQAQITIKYCQGSARKAERILGKAYLFCDRHFFN